MDKNREDYWTKELERAESAKVFPRMAIAAGMTGFAIAAVIGVIGLIFNTFLLLPALALAAASLFSLFILGSSFEGRVTAYNDIYDAYQAEKNRSAHKA